MDIRDRLARLENLVKQIRCCGDGGDGGVTPGGDPGLSDVIDNDNTLNGPKIIDGDGNTLTFDLSPNNLIFNTGNQDVGFIWVSDANGGGDWVDPTNIIPTLTPNWDETLNEDNIAIDKNATIKTSISNSNSGFYLTNNNDQVKGSLVYFDGDGSYLTLLNEVNSLSTIIEPSITKVSNNNTGDTSFIEPTAIQVQNKVFTSDQLTIGGVIEAFNRFTQISDSNVVIAWITEIPRFKWGLIEVKYIARDISNKLASGKAWASIINEGGGAVIQGQADIIPIISSISGALLTFDVSGNNALITVENGAGGATTWQLDVNYTIFTY